MVAAAASVLALMGCARRSDPPPTAVAATAGIPERGQRLLAAYGCGACHAIPGVRGATSMVGPPLDHWSYRRYIAGAVPNTPEQLVVWIQVPQAIQPGSAMPNVGVIEQDARDMAAYLYTLR